MKTALVLYDSDDKETQKQIIKDFKKNMKIDILIVFNMLLTGFDAPRLKRLYLGRKLKDHNLLQAITRVNRPYKDNRYGYIVDFADIKKNFEETNTAYLKELNRFSDPNEVGDGNVTDTFSQVIEDKDILIQQMQEVRQTLFEYSTDNLEKFSSEIYTIEDKKELLKLKKILISARDCCNIVRTFGDDELKEAFSHLEFSKLPQMIFEVQHHINNINEKEAFSQDDVTKQIINEAMADITFKFRNIGSEELKLISGGEELKEKWNRTIHAFTDNIDPEDAEYITLREAFMQRFKKHGFVVDNVEEFEEHSRALDEILKKLKELQKKNTVLLYKYRGDVKFARVHKRIQEENVTRKKKEPIISKYDDQVMNVLLYVKEVVDQKVYDRNDILKKDAYFERTVMVETKSSLDRLNISSSRSDREFIQKRIAKQYLSQYNDMYASV
jgi:type I restriction enzyme R subunit